MTLPPGVTPELSPKDRALPRLNDFVSPFVYEAASLESLA